MLNTFYLGFSLFFVKLILVMYMAENRKELEKMDDAEAFKTRMRRAQKRKKWLIKYGYRALVIVAVAMLLMVAVIIIFDL